ncbi:glycosyltransferase [Polaribacter tangerinus]|uniref:glycosyltransferase n=1 Tax=Polaribacter tangerinus TaxID=1920034 RepID=UPI000B4A7E0A|nr:glycosyltransferase [Polaribacter tangerinus]
MQKKTVLIIGTVWVEPTSSAAGKRMLQLIYQFLEQQYSVVFATTSIKTDNAFSLSSIGVKEVVIQLNNASFDDFICQLKPQIVLFDRFMTEEQFGWRVSEQCPNAIRVLDTEDLHCLRITRALCHKKKYKFSLEYLLSQEITKREIAAILRCDLSLIISTFEMELLKNTFKIDERILLYLPFLFDKISIEQQQSWKKFEERAHFIFIGNYLHKPNVDAVLTLKNEVWPLIRKQLREAVLHVYGAYVSQQIKQLHNEKEGFIVKGYATDANLVVGQAKVVLAPLNFGAGIKGKLTEAMCCGTPSVTTSIGVEGMSLELPWNGFVTDNYSEFSKKAISLFTHKSSWNIAQQNGVEIINTLYNKDEKGILFFEKLATIIQHLEKHRAYNFLGSLLQHQTMQATKYMSKWIEEKNNKNLK